MDSGVGWAYSGWVGSAILILSIYVTDQQFFFLSQVSGRSCMTVNQGLTVFYEKFLLIILVDLIAVLLTPLLILI